MAINYNPKDAVSCLEEGVYKATIEGAEETVSKNNNEMIVFTLKVYGRYTATLKDWIVVPAAIWKLKRVAEAIGKIDHFATGEFDADEYIGANLCVELAVESSDKYGDQNRVRNYHAKDWRPREDKDNQPVLYDAHEESDAEAQDVPF